MCVGELWRSVVMSDEYFGLGCSDGNCRIRGRRGGMHTNGGCKCLRYAEEAEKVKKLIAIARQAENLLAHLPSNTIPDNTKHSAELLRQAIREVNGE